MSIKEPDAASPLIWIDLEMTGLDLNNDRIIEIATIVTDSELNTIAIGPELAIYQNNIVMDSMDEWCIAHHGQSGLTQRVKASKISEQEAEKQTLDFLNAYLEAGQSPMCGNSVHNDRRFLEKYMPELAAFFHYRHLDVSTLKELAKRWAPSVYKRLEKKNTHLALEDVKESIAELQLYREHFLKSEI